jgi:hypothetical protein
MVVKVVHHSTAQTITGEQTLHLDEKAYGFGQTLLISQPVLSDPLLLVQTGCVGEVALGVVGAVLVRLEVLHVFDGHLNNLGLLDASSALKRRRLQSF